MVWRSTGALKIGNLARRNEKQKRRLRNVKSTISKYAYHSGNMLSLSLSILHSPVPCHDASVGLSQVYLEPAIVEKVVCAVPRSGSLPGGPAAHEQVLHQAHKSLPGGPAAHEQVLHQAHKSLLAVRGSASTMNVRSSTTGTMLRPERPAGPGLLFSPTTLVFPMYV